jgi:hypothetical protein
MRADRLLAALAATAALGGCGGTGTGVPDLSDLPHVAFNEPVTVDLPAGAVRVYVEIPEPVDVDPGLGISGGPAAPAAADVLVRAEAGDARLPIEAPEALTQYTTPTRGGRLIGTVDVPSAGRYVVRARLADPTPGSYVGLDPVG